jgi:N6-adenosine-specific RNA methylase IME4
MAESGAATGWPFGDLLMGHYRTILIDPPWRFKTYSRKGERKSPQAHYDCMTLADIQAMPVKALAHADGAALVMWATAPLLPEAVATMAAWGFTFKSAGAWGKRSSTGQKWAFGPGYCFRSAAEFYLLGTVGKIKPISHSVRNLIVAPVREHSRKPDQLHRDLEALYPPPRCEVFARMPRAGWDVWGN